MSDDAIKQTFIIECTELLLEMGRYRESIKLYKQALEIDSTFWASYIGIAGNYDFLREIAASLFSERDMADSISFLS